MHTRSCHRPAPLTAAEALEADHGAALAQWRLQVERARYEAERAERRYRQVEPEHRLVARGLERLAAHYPDATIAGILNRQGRRSATGERFTAIIVGGLRRYRGIPAHQPSAEQPDGEPLPIAKAAEILGVAPSTLHRWLNDGFVAGEQDTPGAPWRIRVNDQLRALFVEEAPAGFVPIVDAM